MSCYHPKAKSLNPQGRSLKLASHWAIPTLLRQALVSTFLTSTGIFSSLLNYTMPDGITCCSAFPEDAVFGSIINYFQFRWTGFCIAIPEYEQEDVLQQPFMRLHLLKAAQFHS